MADCCARESRFNGLSRGFRAAFWAVIAINALMFGVEITAVAAE